MLKKQASNSTVNFLCIDCKHKFECLTNSYIICTTKYHATSVGVDLSSGSSSSAIPGVEVKYYSYEPRN